MITVAVSTTGEAGALEEVIALAGAVAIPAGDQTTSSEWDAAMIDLRSDPLQQLRAAKRVHEDSGCPVIVVIASAQTALLNSEKWIDEFIVDPIDALELQARLNRLAGPSESGELLAYKSLTLNLATYQATIDGTPIDLTYMEYELLRYFIEHQGRVWSREQLLQNVWGYDYFGGARTVDVHVRRLRAKLGGERASWITTVRSVGYRFG
ncbi:MAG: winged helix-turn-helix domain-containing protein [Acidimicrobiia bacterium]